jgi:hypothetical protein
LRPAEHLASGILGDLEAVVLRERSSLVVSRKLGESSLALFVVNI